MSYELLRGLYYGEATNADLTTAASRQRLHVATALEDFIEGELSLGRDVILTGNPGDGKSHLVRTLQERGELAGVEVQLDLSAEPTAVVVQQWAGAAVGERPLLLCANEGPLLELLTAAATHEHLSARVSEVRGQLQRLLVADARRLPTRPSRATLVDLADRNLLDVSLLEGLLGRVCRLEFLPGGLSGSDTMVGRNLRLLLASSEARRRLARLLGAIGTRLEGHITFREVWQTVSYTLCAGLTEAQLRSADPMTAASPLDHLCGGRGRAPLLALGAEVDPARVAAPDLDDDLWRFGRPTVGRWLVPMEGPEVRPPGELWSTDPQAALAAFRHLKRLVALWHEAGGWLVEHIAGRSTDAPEASGEILEIVEGLRRMFLAGPAETDAPPWLVEGLPLWVGHSYAGTGEGTLRPYVAVDHVALGEFELRRPLRAPWLEQALGAPPPLTWLSHRPSDLALALTPRLIAMCRLAGRTDGPLDPPIVVQRFLARLSGWRETHQRDVTTSYPMAVLDRPRGELVVHARVEELYHVGAHYARG